MSSTPTRLPVTPVRRRVVLVVGAARSGASVMAGSLQALGMHVPEPHDDAGESRWVVDFHTAQLRRANLDAADARPTAWFEAAKVNTFGPLRVELADWLDQQFSAETPEVVIKDPQLAWFLGLWRAAALRCDAAPSYVTVLRPVPEVVDVDTATTDVAGWLNVMLHTERSTRGSARGFVRYDDLLADWTVPLNELGRTLDLQSVQEASANHVRAVHAFVDPALRHSRQTWDDLDVPARLRELADETWQALNKLADPGGDTPDVHELLDELRTGYAELYDEAEAIARSSAVAAANEQVGGPAAGASSRVSGSARRGLRKAFGRE